jgi:hypothetical protein
VAVLGHFRSLAGVSCADTRCLSWRRLSAVLDRRLAMAQPAVAVEASAGAVTAGDRIDAVDLDLRAEPVAVTVLC